MGRMKKQIIAFLLLMVIGAQMMTHFGYTKAEATEQKVIPDEAIRLRILANSDSEEDQALKRKVRDRVKAQIDAWVVNLTSIEDARHIIQSRLPELEKTVEQTLREEKSNQSFTVEFGKHIKFPTKVYGNFLYPAGEYEAVLVKLGKGEGANWWCVLFPPLCFLDFSSGTAVAQEDVQNVPAPAAEGAAEEKQTEARPEEKPKQTVAEQKNVAKEQPKQEERNIKKVQTEAKNITETEVKAKDVAQSKVDEQPSEPKKEEAKEKSALEEVDQKEQSKKIVVKEEEEPQVKFFIVEAFSSLFSK